MKITLTFKTPDVVWEALQGLSEEEKIEAQEAISNWVEYEEYATIEIDTKTGEAEVVPV